MGLTSIQLETAEAVLARAECLVGDIMYELAQQKAAERGLDESEDDEAVMREVELMSGEDLRYCRREAIGGAVGWREPRDGLIDEALSLWERRGF